MIRTPVISLTLAGAADALLTVDGPLDPAAVARVRHLLDATVLAGCRHVIADLSAAAPVSPELHEVLAGVSWELAGRGGWLLIEGIDDSEDGAVRSSLLDAFRAYREATAA